jgi:FkbM family methyltransferase
MDVGANHPTIGNNTYLFYLRGWRGVLVEPIKKNCELLSTYRPDDIIVNKAASDHTGVITLYECDDNSVSSVDPQIAEGRRAAGQGVIPTEVECTTIRNLLGDLSLASVPDILSIDVEGHERAVLEGCPFEKGWRPRVIVLEACIPCTRIPCHDEWEALLLGQGYKFHETCGVNRLYVLT